VIPTKLSAKQINSKYEMRRFQQVKAMVYSCISLTQMTKQHECSKGKNNNFLKMKNQFYVDEKVTSETSGLATL